MGRSRSTESPVAATFRHLGTSRDVSGRPCRQRNPGRGRGGASASTARGGSHRPIPREWLGGTRGDEAARPPGRPREPRPRPGRDAVLGSGASVSEERGVQPIQFPPGGAAPWACSACPAAARRPTPRQGQGQGPGPTRAAATRRTRRTAHGIPRMSNQSPRRRRRRRSPRAATRAPRLTRCAPPP